MKNFHGLIVAIILFLSGGQTVFSRPTPPSWLPVTMEHPEADTNSSSWHTVKITPDPRLPKIHFYEKFNPVWWLKNADEPAPPAWYLPGDHHRVLKWHFRNPFHNFDFYVIGVADKNFARSGFYPERNSNPHGGWDFEIVRRWLVLLPFISYEREKITFYFGWREHGAFGAELRFHHKPAASVPVKTAH